MNILRVCKALVAVAVSATVISCGSSEPTAIGSWGVLGHSDGQAVEKLRIEESGQAKFLEYECQWQEKKAQVLDFDCVIGSDHAEFKVELLSENNIRLDAEVYHRLN